jgi:hypothetical protein
MFKLFKRKKELNRQQRSEAVLKKHNIKINHNLPQIEQDHEITLRTMEETAQRATILAVANLVAFHTINGKQALDFLDKYHLTNVASPKEITFLTNPTDELKLAQTWKCEAIWTLLWALYMINELGFPDQLCDLSQVPEGQYPIVINRDPNEFIKSAQRFRSKGDILDANDLYYRLDWACVDARINNREINGLHPGVVYERHYALNWLINYRDQEWDDVTCDT